MRADHRPPAWHGPSPAELLDRVASPTDLQRLKWWQFEHVVGEILARIGYDDVVVLNARGADGGVDIKANWRGQAVIFQVKHLRTSEFAPIDTVRAFAFVTQRVGAVAGYFVTTGQFGRTAAEEAARSRPPVHLVDNQGLWRWVEQARRAGVRGAAAVPVLRSQVPGGVAAAGWHGADTLRMVGLASLLLVLGLCGLGAVGAAIAPRASVGARPYEASSAAPTTSIPVSDAKAAVKEYWDRNEVAWVAGDAKALPQLYAGPGLDRAIANMAAKSGDHPGKYVRPFKSATVFLPAAASGNQWFIASIQYVVVNQDGVGLGYSGPPVTALFVRDAEDWKVYARDFPAPGLPAATSVFGGTPDHFVLPSPQPSAPFIADADATPAQLVAYETALSAGQKPESLFPTTYGNYPEAAVKTSVFPGNQAIVKATFEVSGRTFRYTGADGSQEVIFEVRRSVKAAAAKATGCLYQPSSGTFTVSDLVPAGNYAEISAVNLATVAISVPRRSDNPAIGRQLVGVAGAGRDVSYQATKGSCR